MPRVWEQSFQVSDDHFQWWSPYHRRSGENFHIRKLRRLFRCCSFGALRQIEILKQHTSFLWSMYSVSSMTWSRDPETSVLLERQQAVVTAVPQFEQLDPITGHIRDSLRSWHIVIYQGFYQPWDYTMIECESLVFLTFPQRWCSADSWNLLSGMPKDYLSTPRGLLPKMLPRSHYKHIG